MTQCRPAGLRILLVEDEMLIAILIEDLLQGLGCHVVGPSGEQARRRAAAGTRGGAGCGDTGCVHPRRAGLSRG